MKRFINYIGISAIVCTAMFTSCKDDKGVSKLPSPVPLKMEINTSNLVMGDVLEVKFSVIGNEEEGLGVMNEDLNIKMTAKTALGDADAFFFKDFPEVVTLNAGDKEKIVPITVKEEGINRKYSVELTAMARGYKLNGASQILNISDHYYTSVGLKNNADAAVTEGKGFVLTADLDVAPEEDLVINIDIPENEKKLYEGMPESLVIAKGKKTADSERVKLISTADITEDMDLSINLSLSSTKYPLMNNKITLKRISLHKDMGVKVADERWCYPDPSMMFVSERNEKAVQEWGKIKDEDYEIMLEGTEHPGAVMSPELSKWKFLRAYEFHPIPSCLTKQRSNDGTFESDRMPRCFGNEGVHKVESAGGVDNAKYSWVTDDGFYRMITVKEQTTAQSTGQTKNYGTSAVYSAKFFAEKPESQTWETANIRIYPGMRLEVRARMRDCERTGMLPGIWCQGNRQIGGAHPYQIWPAYGEADIMEFNTMKSNFTDNVEVTYHWGVANRQEGDSNTFSQASNPNGLPGFTTVTEYQIYWLEWRSNSEIAMGVNGEEVNVLKTPLNRGDWPFTTEINDDGLHFLLTMMFLDSYVNNIRLHSGDKGYKLAREDISGVARMEIDWVRFYIDDTYNLPESKKWRDDLLFY